MNKLIAIDIAPQTSFLADLKVPTYYHIKHVEGVDAALGNKLVSINDNDTIISDQQMINFDTFGSDDVRLVQLLMYTMELSIKSTEAWKEFCERLHVTRLCNGIEEYFDAMLEHLCVDARHLLSNRIAVEILKEMGYTAVWFKTPMIGQGHVIALLTDDNLTELGTVALQSQHHTYQ